MSPRVPPPAVLDQLSADGLQFRVLSLECGDLSPLSFRWRPAVSPGSPAGRAGRKSKAVTSHRTPRPRPRPGCAGSAIGRWAAISRRFLESLMPLPGTRNDENAACSLVSCLMAEAAAGSEAVRSLEPSSPSRSLARTSIRTRNCRPRRSGSTRSRVFCSSTSPGGAPPSRRCAMDTHVLPM